MRRLIQSTAVFGLSGAVGKGLALILAPLYTHRITPDEYGTLGLFLAAGALLSIAMGAGFRQASTRMWFQADSSEKKSYLSTNFWTLVILTGFTLALGFVLAPAICAWLGKSGFAWALRAVIVSCALDTIASVPVGLARLRKRGRQTLVLTSIMAVGTLVCALVLVGLLDRGFVGVIETTVFASTLKALVWLPTLRHDLRFEFSHARLRASLPHAIPFVPHHLFALASARLDLYFVHFLASPVEVGLYFLGSKISSGMSFVTTAIHQATMPERYKVFRKNDTLDDLFTHSVHAAVLSSIAIGLTVAFAREAVLLLAPPIYRDAWWVVAWLGLEQYFLVLYVYMGTPGVDRAHKTFLYPLFSGSGLFVGALLSVILIPAIGMQGAALARAGQALAMLATAHITSQRVHPLAYPLKAFFSIGALGAAMVGTALLSQRLPFALSLAFKIGWAALVLTIAARSVLSPVERPRRV